LINLFPKLLLILNLFEQEGFPFRIRLQYRGNHLSFVVLVQEVNQHGASVSSSSSSSPRTTTTITTLHTSTEKRKKKCYIAKTHVVLKLAERPAGKKKDRMPTSQSDYEIRLRKEKPFQMMLM